MVLIPNIIKRFNFLIYLILNLFFYPLYGQSGSLSIGIGGANYSGDLTGEMIDVVLQTRPSFSIGTSVELAPTLHFKVQYFLLGLKADDKYADADWQRARALKFKSTVHELNILAMINPAAFFTDYMKRHNFFLIGGVSYFHFNPRAYYNGNWYDLQKLGTEGQGLAGHASPYSLNSAAIDFGFVYRYFINPKYSIEVEYITRQTRTDYLDDASTNYVDYVTLRNMHGVAAAELGNKIKAANGSKRAELNDKDWYNTLMLSINYHFGYNTTLRKKQFSNRRITCPN